MGSGDERRRVAVVSVHGVADQQPGETVSAVADMLRRHCDYTWAGRTEVRIPVRAISTEFSSATAPEVGDAKPVDRACFTSETMRAARDGGAGLSGGVPLDMLEMRERFVKYRPESEDATYATDRIDLGLPETGAGVCHVYEFYWADLSRLKRRVVETFVAFFQLLFYLCDLGGRTIDYARAGYGKGRAWAWLERCHLCAHIMLVLGVPLLNFALLGLVLSGVGGLALHRSGILEAHGVNLIAGVVGVVGAGVLAVRVVRGRVGRPEDAWGWAILWIILLVGVLYFVSAWILGAAQLESGTVSACVAFLLWLIAASIVVWVGYVYRLRRRGALLAAALLVLTVTAVFLAELWSRSPSTPDEFFEAYRGVILWHIACVHWPLWTGIALTTLSCWLVIRTGWLVRGLRGHERCRARRCGGTVMISLGVPAALILCLELGVWQLVLLGFGRMPEGSFSAAWRTKMELAFDLAIPRGFAIGGALLLLAAVVAAWMLLPAVLAERRRTEEDPGSAGWLGGALSSGFRRLRWSGRVVYTVTTAGILAGVVLLVANRPAPLGSRSVDAWAALVAGGLIFVCFAFRQGGAVFRSIVDVALDVINWMRNDPPTRTPAARIAGRFASLLEHLAAWRDPVSGKGYDGIVIIAHSLGSVITADLLRYLRFVREPGLPPGNGQPTSFFTMGCPLWQLHSLRFPDRYGWARDGGAESWAEAGKPDPGELGVRVWSNFYRSGDYVGRSLWHPDAGEAATAWGEELRVDESGRRRERCIGFGAHTHYWDETAREIALELDRLVRSIACEEGPDRDAGGGVGEPVGPR